MATKKTPAKKSAPAAKAPAKRDNSKFKKTLHGKSTYECGVCGKLTRETGHGEDSCDLCAFCYAEAGLENSLSDGNITQEEFDAEMAVLRKRYKRSAPKADAAPVAAPKAKKPTRAVLAEAEFIQESYAARGVKAPSIEEIAQDLMAKKTAKKAEPVPVVEKVKAPKAVKLDAAPAPKAKPTKEEDARVITLLVKENPKRAGTKAWAKWELYKNGMTVAAYLAAGGKRSTIRWDLRHELIAVK